MQSAKRNAPIDILADRIGANTTNNITERTEMNTSMQNDALATKPALAPVPGGRAELNPTEMRLMVAIAKLNDKTGKFLVDLAESLTDSPLHVKAVRTSLRLVQGGAA